jgi:hypothetical protein
MSTLSYLFRLFSCRSASNRAVGGETSTRGVVPRVDDSFPTTHTTKNRQATMGINTPKRNRIDQTTAEQTLIDGLRKHAAELPSMVISGTTRNNRDLVAILQSRIDSANAALSTRATWRTAIRTDQTLRATTKTVVSGLRQGLLVAFEGQLDTLADFGLTARAVHVATPEEKAASTAKAKATRAARHTLGPKQKAEIKGTVTPTGSA